MTDIHTGDFGAVPDSAPSVPSGDSVTLIERWAEYGRQPSPDGEGTCFAVPPQELIDATVARLAVLELRESERSKGLDSASALVEEEAELERLANRGALLDATTREQLEATLRLMQSKLGLRYDYLSDREIQVRYQVRGLISWALKLLDFMPLTSATAALPPPESGSGLGSASALEVEATSPGFVIASNHPNYSETPCPLCKQHWRVCDDCHARPEGEC